jgi:hypothetical protein
MVFQSPEQGDFFARQLFRNKLNIKANIHRKHIGSNISDPCCNAPIEEPCTSSSFSWSQEIWGK